jgi:hypothetical protein
MITFASATISDDLVFCLGVSPERNLVRSFSAKIRDTSDSALDFLKRKIQREFSADKGQRVPRVPADFDEDSVDADVYSFLYDGTETLQEMKNKIGALVVVLAVSPSGETRSFAAECRGPKTLEYLTRAALYALSR